MKEVDELYCIYLTGSAEQAEETLKKVGTIFFGIKPKQQEKKIVNNGLIFLFGRYTCFYYYQGEEDKSEYYFDKYKTWYLKNKGNSKEARKFLRTITVQSLANETLKWDTKANDNVPPKWFLDLKKSSTHKRTNELLK